MFVCLGLYMYLYFFLVDFEKSLRSEALGGLPSTGPAAFL